MDRQPPSSAAAAVVDCAVYVDGVRLPGTHTPESALDEVRRRGSGFVWLGLFAPTFEQMTAYLAEQKMARQYIPERLEIVTDLPRTPSGKVQKFKLRETARGA